MRCRSIFALAEYMKCRLPCVLSLGAPAETLLAEDLTIGPQARRVVVALSRLFLGISLAVHERGLRIFC